ncbi:MAG: ShlB/FhaC/HecB family hemolysin secretion/activation protein [Gemmatimonadales bacterium]
MGTALLNCLSVVALFPGIFRSDTTTYVDRATQQLVARAMARHAEQDSTVKDYHAKLRYRMSFGFAKRKWGDPLPVAVEEQDATLAWQLPNDLRVDMLGRRTASQLQGVDLATTFSHPWFVPRTLGDSLRIFGASQTPSRAAPHPLAPGADRFYRYAAGDSVVISSGARRITIRNIAVVPKFSDGAYVAGRLWVDVATGDVARFTFRFVGTELWSEPDGTTSGDSAAARRTSKFVSRILELNADLEFSLQEGRYWMPYREVISGRVSMPFGIDFAIPFEARTTFDDYTVNGGTRVVFDAPFPRDSNARGRNRGTLRAHGDTGSDPSRANRPDSLHQRRDSSRAKGDSSGVRFRFRNRTGYLAGGGRYEIHRPPLDSMQRYHGWGDSLVLHENEGDRRHLQQAMSDLAHLAESLPPEMTGRPGIGVAWEKLSDVLRYNRVEGTTLSIGGRLPIPHSFTDIYGTLRYGFADQRVMARIAAVRDAPAGRLTFAISRDLSDADLFTSGLTFGNSLRAILSGHDDGAYFLVQGARLTYETSGGLGTEWVLTARTEDQESVTTGARAFFPRIVGSTGYFPATSPIRNGFAGGGGVSIDHTGLMARWTLNGEALVVNGYGAARVAGELWFRRLAGGWLTTRAKIGLAVGSDSVPQLALRAGGQGTVRGYDFGVSQGDALWAMQLDVSRPSRSAVKLVAFVDAGQAGNRTNFGATPFLSGAGVGVSVLGGIVRAELSHPITYTTGRGLRFDIVFGGIR